MPSPTELPLRVARIVAATPVLDIHTHLYDPSFGSLLLWGIDDLLVYHYLVSESFRQMDVPYDRFWAASKTEQADLIWSKQLKDEITAYNPLIPKGSDLVATIMFEIDDPVARHHFLSQIGNVERHFLMEIAGDAVAVRPEDDLERTNEAGKTSSIHFVHFDLTKEQIAKFKTAGTRVMVGIDHPHYGHVAIMSEQTRAALSDDLAG